MLKVTKSRFYVVPILMRTLDILELLSRSGGSLKTNEISRITGISQTTTYRILRTLIHRGYVAQDLEGRFSLLNRPGMNATTEPARSHKTDLTGEQVIEILHSVLQTMKQPDEGGLDHNITSRQNGS
jgi:hypothetical protein